LGKILGIEPEKEMSPILNDRPWFDYSERQKANMLYIFRTELPVAMTIILQTQSFKLGKYKRPNKYSTRGWEFKN